MHQDISTQTDDIARKAKFTRIIVGYPIALTIIAVVTNLVAFGVAPPVVALPTLPVVTALIISATLLLINHTWAMTSTELTRLRYDMHATPEEWAASNSSPLSVSQEAARELERRHNAHRNATENTVYFAVLAIVISIVSPTVLAAQVWIMGFAIGRLGHMFSYLTGNDGLRGAFMSVSLVSLYGLASYLVLSLMA